MTVRPLWTLAEVLDAVGEAGVEGPIVETGETGRDSGGDSVSFGGVSIDSRTVSAGDLFVAIRGEHLDGHDFAAAAIDAGASAAVVAAEGARSLQALDLPLIIVPDPLVALTRLATAARQRSGARIVAVTGSVGKTTTKELIRQVLETQGKIHFSPASYNNLWGVPLSLARMPADARFAVLEVGMNHAGEIEPLARLVRPHVAVITHVSPVHLEFLRDLDAVAAAKAEVFAGLEPRGIAVLGADHDRVDWLAEKARQSGAYRVVTYGVADDAEVRVDVATGRVRLGERELTLDLALPGGHSLVNAAAALAIASLFDVPLEPAVRALERAKAGPGRGVVHRLAASVTLIDESYNANPASMRAALAVLGNQPAAGRRIAVLGDMLELGAAAPKHHAALSEAILAAGVQKVFLVGSEMKSLADALPAGIVAEHAATAAEIRDKLLNLLASGDVVMVKGSNAIGLSALVEAIIERFGAPAGQQG